MSDRKATIVVDLGFGDAGKGSIVDYLARNRKVSTVVRFNGGAQAAHNVVTPDGVHHTFAQFGSGTFVPGVKTHLSRFMLLDLPALQAEAHHLQDLGCGNVFSRLTVDENALVVTPFMKAANHLREMLRGAHRHGSCGMGIGETYSHSLQHPDDAIRVRDLRDPAMLLQKLERQQEFQHEAFRERLPSLYGLPPVSFDAVLLADPSAPRNWATSLHDLAQPFTIVSGDYLRKLLARDEVIFEGAQGVLIDEWHGFHPHTTWSTTTFDNALMLLAECGYDAPVTRLGLLRPYSIRHGAGPFPTEDNETLRPLLTEEHNRTGVWQGDIRLGWFDQVLTRYAIHACQGVDALAVTNLDRWSKVTLRPVCTRYMTGGKNAPPVSSLDRRIHIRSDRDSDFVERITARRSPKDHRFQDQLTSLIKDCLPIFNEEWPADNDDYLKLMSERLGVPIVLTSTGPTAADKRPYHRLVEAVTVG